MTHCSFLALFFLSFCYFSLNHAQAIGFSVELIHRDSPRSPFFNPTETQFQRVSNAVRRSINRANHFNKDYVPTNTPQTTIIPDRGEYLMSYSIGTPPFQLYSIVDTGSGIVWSQCKPCETCYNQTSPMFEPSKSTSYRTIPCSSTTCQSLHGTCSSGNCQYGIKYGDGSHSQGDLSLDTLTLGSTDGSLISIINIMIGCGHNNYELFQGQNSGVVGLGCGPLSLITQLRSSIDGRFSYCLVPMFSKPNSSSKLSFGHDAVAYVQGTVSTPLYPDRDGNTFYYLRLDAFSVGDNRIEFPSPPGPLDSGNIIIDSGTTLTLLPHDVYSKLESAVANVVKLERVYNAIKELSLCYKIPASQFEVPIITAHFNAADVQLMAMNTFIQISDQVVCLAFTTSQDVPIFGNLAQQNFLIGYDVLEKVVSFRPMDCA